MAEDKNKFAFSYCWWFRNPANQLSLVVYLPLFTRFYKSHPRWLALEFLPSNSISPPIKRSYIFHPTDRPVVAGGWHQQEMRRRLQHWGRARWDPTDLTGWSFFTHKNFGKKWCGCSLKWWYPQIIHFNRAFHYKPSILGYPYFWKHPYRTKIMI